MTWDCFKISSEHSHSMSYRCAELGDLEVLVELHVSNYDALEFSMQLSRVAVKKFYELCLVRGDVSVLVGVNAKGSVFCFSLAFAQYPDFLSEYKKRAFWDVVFTMVKGALTLDISRLVAILSYLFERGVKMPPAAIMDFYMGNMVLDSRMAEDPEALILFCKMYERNVALLKEVSGGCCWTSVFQENKRSVRITKGVLGPDSSFLMRRKLKPTTCFICSG